jgi:hypothetical protein
MRQPFFLGRLNQTLSHFVDPPSFSVLVGEFIHSPFRSSRVSSGAVILPYLQLPVFYK